ncbi:beta-lactamase [Kribbella flavida DSM 17836]|uniref:Beta-lactamase n=1 Tax=Kribbella flavida (strain DSM 17836 / JCM 10339 / NBRC 14399) TaxID=479435 RepID=D2Q356_KRIFD|nr:serine hydrolase [Kribbella flavida]ADB32181.1 beta-lactamase [Kribbella flavida DSM 17836]
MGMTDLLRGVQGQGDFGVWLGRLDGVPVFMHAAERPHYSASTMKVLVAMAMLRKVDAGELSLEQPVTVHNDFASAAGGRFGVNRAEDEAPATWTKLGEQVTLGWLATEMITRSSNLATNLVLEQAGVDTAQAVLAEYGSGASAIQRGIDDVAAQAAGISNLMSPADLAAVLVAAGNDDSASGRYLRDLLAANEWNGEIPAGVPAGTRVEHKNGWDVRIRHDGGIVRPADAEPFVLTVCTTSELPDPDAQKLIAAIAAEAWNHRHELEAVR